MCLLCCAHCQATLDTTMIINMLQDISARLNVVDSTTQDVSARLNMVETKIGAGGASSGASATATSKSALEQMNTMLRQQGSDSGDVFSYLTCTPLMLVTTNDAPDRCVLLSVRSSAFS